MRCAASITWFHCSFSFSYSFPLITLETTFFPRDQRGVREKMKLTKVTMNEGKERITVPSHPISRGIGSKKTLSLTNCSLIFPVVSLLQMVWKTIAANQRRQACGWSRASPGPAGVRVGLGLIVFLWSNISCRFLFDFKVRWLGHYLLNYSI